MPVILDAGVGTASRRRAGDGARLRRGAVRAARSPAPRIPSRWRARCALAVEAGLLARGAGRIPQRLHATASTAEAGTAEFVHPSDPAAPIPAGDSRDGATDLVIDPLLDAFQAALVGRDRAAFAACLRARRPLRGSADRSAPLRGCDALGDHAARLWVASPNATIEQAGERLGDGRFVAAPVRLTGTHTGELPGLPPTRKPFSVHAVLYCELDPPRERLWRIRAFFDLYDASVQLGVLPAHGGVGERALMLLRGFGLRARS